MKRSAILSLFAVTLTALCATTAQATVNAQLNLRYNRPDAAQDPNSIRVRGGSWQLLVQSNTTFGIAGIRFVIEGIDGVDGINDGNITGNNQVWTDPNDPSVFNFNFVSPLDPNDPSVEIIAGDDLNGPLILFVGTGPNTPGNRAVDDLNNSFWDNSAMIASGTFSGIFTDPNGMEFSQAPSLLSIQANEWGADPNTTIVLASNGTLSTRGDSWTNLGLEADPNAGLDGGDSNRDGIVDGSDAAILGGNWQDDGNDPNFDDPFPNWDDGDYNSDGIVDGGDAAILGGNWQHVGTPPAIGVVPEPATFALTGGALVTALLGSRRRRYWLGSRQRRYWRKQ